MNDAELTALVRGYQDEVFRYLRFLGASFEMAEDVGQEVFVTAFSARRFPEADQPAARRAWLRETARRLLLASWRKAGCQPKATDPATLERADQAWTAMTGQGEPDLEEAMSRLRACMEKLSQREREAVALRFGEDAVFAELGRHLGVSEEGARSLVRRILARLAGCMKQAANTSGE